MYLSYRPLQAPVIADAAMNHIHLLWAKSTFSFLLERLSISRESIARTTPPHCQPFSLSPNRSVAPRSTRIGLVALIGPTIVIGRCFRPKYPNSQEASTIQDFAKVIRWACTAPDAPPDAPPSTMDEMMNGEKIRVENTVFRNSTGITALSFKDAFWRYHTVPAAPRTEMQEQATYCQVQVCKLT